MKKNVSHNPDYLFETSWEVCNRVGGIYAVLSTRAAVMEQAHPGHVVFFGPDLGATSDRYFIPDASVLPIRNPAWRIGRWDVPGKPIAVLVRWDEIVPLKNNLYAWAWDEYGVQSHAAYGDYDESCLFAYAVGQAMQHVYEALHEPVTTAHMNEWQTAFTLFYLHSFCPKIATLFTTHATGIGRSIAGNGKPLYDYFGGYHGDQMAEELNMVSKHSAEKMAARWADCFTTVSDITARECKQLLDKQVDIVTPNGFEQAFVPKGRAFVDKRKKARQALIHTANIITNKSYTDEVQMIGIAGRLEWKNKGIDVFMDSMRQLAKELPDGKEVLAFVIIPYLNQSPLYLDHVTVICLPYYLPTEGHLPVSEMPYYDVLIGLDLTVFPSYYEPWGYTPLESIAFGVPTITTSLSGFGAWCAANDNDEQALSPVRVIKRTDSNYWDVVQEVAHTARGLLMLSPLERQQLSRKAKELSRKADWKHFFTYYKKAYEIAIQHNQSNQQNQ